MERLPNHRQIAVPVREGEEVVPPLPLHPEPEGHGLPGRLTDLEELLSEGLRLTLPGQVAAHLSVHW